MKPQPDQPALALEFRVTVQGISPLIWRHIRISNSSSLAVLHWVLQVGLAWQDQPSYQFSVHGFMIAESRDANTLDARVIKLMDLQLRVGEKLVYSYQNAKPWKLELRLMNFVNHNQGFIVNYGERYHHGERISTGFVESTVNYVLAKRFSKKQSMQWTITGAHDLLQVRTRVLNGDLETEFRKWYPLFPTSAGGIPEIAKLELPPEN